MACVFDTIMIVIIIIHADEIEKKIYTRNNHNNGIKLLVVITVSDMGTASVLWRVEKYVFSKVISTNIKCNMF